MEADWDVEIGPDAPCIVVPWPGFVDLRYFRASVDQILEAACHPALADALAALNTTTSPVFTAKCDIWQLQNEEIDPDEFNARPESARTGFASYIDVLLREQETFRSFQFHERLVRHITTALRTIELANCRVDLVLRAAIVDTAHGYGVAVYTAGCGAENAPAYSSWQAVLRATVNATMNMPDLSDARASSSIG
ncbi:MAG: hypothetical protein JOZ83_05510 [Silvibacterium sp.]|nr:hypothetical protein [Silvibacterium sp.]